VVAFADKPLLHFTDPAEWERFLEQDPPDDGVRLLLLKKAATVPGIRYAEALDVALCFGWIDGQVKRHDDDFVEQAFTPRRRASPWSQINREHVARLIEAGRMRPGGQAEIDRARGDGRWDAAYRIKDTETPAELQAALDADPAAAAAFAALKNGERWMLIFRVSQLKRPETRARRSAEYAAKLSRGEPIA
jgi:uncharacterized protein YdeI (YjbR/CyaY-like superfamily)